MKKILIKNIRDQIVDGVINANKAGSFCGAPKVFTVATIITGEGVSFTVPIKLTRRERLCIPSRFL